MVAVIEQTYTVPAMHCGNCTRRVERGWPKSTASRASPPTSSRSWSSSGEPASTTPRSAPRSPKPATKPRERTRLGHARDRGDDVRGVRRPSRAEAEPARRRRRGRQPRDRVGARPLRPRRVRLEELLGAVEPAGYRAAPAAASASARRGGRSACRLRAAVGAARPADGAAAPVRGLGVVSPSRSRRRSCSGAGWPFHRGRRPECAPRRRDDGHADLDRHARRLGLVGARARVRTRARRTSRSARSSRR